MSSPDLVSATGHSSERYRRILLIGTSSGAARVITMLTSFVSVPMALAYLGPELYGTWMTANAAIAGLSLAECGVSSSLVNTLATADLGQKADRERVWLRISSAFFLLISIMSATLTLFLASYPLVSWKTLLNVGANVDEAEMATVVGVLVVCLVARLPLNIAAQVQVGLQEAHINAAWKAAGALIGLSGLAVGIYVHASLPWLVFAIAGGPVAAMVGNFANCFLRRHRWMMPRLGAVNSRGIRSVVTVGWLFFGLQSANLISHHADYLIVAHVLGPSSVVQYSIALKMFLIVPTFVVFFLKPLWPAYGSAISLGEVDWLRQTLVRSLCVSLTIMVPCALALSLLTPWIIRLWVGEAVTLPWSLVVGMACFTVIVVIESNVTKVYYAANAIGVCLCVATIMALVNLPLSIYFTVAFGVAGPIVGTVVSRALLTVLPLLLLLPRLFQSFGSVERVVPAMN